jgi:uncharacterized iron-regulated protein
LSEAELALVKLGEAMPQPLIDALNEELADSHCGLMPASAFGSLNLTQRFRDAHLARALIDAAKANAAAFLLAGNGHVRADRAVPWFVERMEPSRRIVSVMLLEVLVQLVNTGFTDVNLLDLAAAEQLFPASDTVTT